MQEKMNTFSVQGGLQAKYTQNICITPEQNTLFFYTNLNKKIQDFQCGLHTVGFAFFHSATSLVFLCKQASRDFCSISRMASHSKNGALKLKEVFIF